MTPFSGLLASQIADQLTEVQGGAHGYSMQNVRTWPCVSGEDFAPTLGGTPAPSYNARAGRPALVMTPQSPAASITWPRVPRRSIDGLPVLRLRWQTIWNGGGPGVASNIVVAYGGDNNPAIAGVWLEINLNNAAAGWTLGSADGAGGATTETALGAATAPAANTWQEWELVLTATQVLCYLNGTLVATHTTDVWTVANTTANITPSIYATQAGGSAIELAVGLFQARWEAA